MEHQQTASELFVFKCEKPDVVNEMRNEFLVKEQDVVTKIIHKSGDNNEMTLRRYFAEFNPDTDDPDYYKTFNGTKSPDINTYKEYTLPEDVLAEWSAIIEINVFSKSDSHSSGNQVTPEFYANEKPKACSSVKGRKHKKRKKKTTSGKKTKKPDLEVIEYSEFTQHSGIKNRDHASSSTVGKKTGASKKSFKCDLCEHVSSNISTAKRHAVKHTGEKPYSCPQCDYTTGWSESLKRHVRAHGKRKPSKLEKQAAKRAKTQACELENQTAECPKEQPSEFEQQAAECPKEQPFEFEQQAAKHVKEYPYELEKQAPKRAKKQACELKKQATKNEKEQPSELEKQAAEHAKDQPSQSASCPFANAWAKTLGSKVKFRVREGSRKRFC